MTLAKSNPVVPAWHTLPQARAILARCQEGEFRVELVMRSAWGENQFVGRTDAARAKLDRLDNLRRAAIDRAMGFTFSEAQQPYDEAKTRAYLHFDASVPVVHVVLRDAFDGRKVADRRAA